jgi:hypothetical protein
MNKQLTEFYKQAFGYPPAPSGEPELEKFAALVAAAEREACANLETEAGVYTKSDLANAIRARGKE